MVCQSLRAADSDFKLAFGEPQNDAKPWVYWYWMNGNITKEGAVEDLRALHRVGVGGAFLMDLGIHPAGPVAYRSTEWFEATGAVMKEAEKLGMQIGFHCPGWSASGGPWITPEKGMQELVWSETTMGSGQSAVGSGQSAVGNVVLPQPPARLGLYRDIAVVAFPALKQDANLLKAHPFKVMAEGKELKGKGAAFDGQPDTGVDFPSSFEIVFAQPVEAHSLYLRLSSKSGDFTALIEAKDTTGSYRKVATIKSGHPGPFSARHGAATFKRVVSDCFRIAFLDRAAKRPFIVEELSLTDGFRLNDWPALAGYGTKPIEAAKDAEQPEPQACVKLSEVLDLTEKMKPDGTLDWQPPNGQWTVLRLGFVPTGVLVHPTANLKGATGLECDKMSSEVTDFHYDNMMKPLFEAYGKGVAGKVLSKYHLDSYEPGWQNWTPGMAKAFKSRRGYDLTRWLPALTGRAVNDSETTGKFLWDFRRTIGDLYADAHYGRLAERCHADGISFSTEPYGGPFEFLQVGGRCDYPMVEFWTGKRNALPVDQTGRKRYFHGVSSAHIYGKRVIGSEAFTSEEGWLIHPYSLKSLGDAIYASGVNQFILHLSAHQPYLREGTAPGFTSGINGIHFDRGNTWFDHGAKEWVDYLTRCQSVLQQGVHVADIAYFQGDDSPCAGARMEPPPPEGVDADAINAEALARARVEESRLVLPDGKRYRYLVLPKNGLITCASLKELVRLHQAGARLAGPRPCGSPSFGDESSSKEYVALVEKVWSGKGLPDPKSLDELFAQDRCPRDFSYTSADNLTLHYTHRQERTRDVYFVANGLKRPGQGFCTFRTDGGRPQVWDPVDGRKLENIRFSVEPDGRLTLPLFFNPSDSFFVVFDRADPKRDSLEGASAPRVAEEKSASVALAGEWTVSFQKHRGAPEQITTKELKTLGAFEDFGVKHFSGTATYRTTFDCSALKSRMWLDLGEVAVIASAKLNGKPLGLRWKPPFRFEVTGLLREGKNELEVDVTTTWVNRLIGDEHFPDDVTPKGTWKEGGMPVVPDWLVKGLPRTEPRRITFAAWKFWKAGDPLHPSGLLGPVRLEAKESRNERSDD
jgi:hypothetical protein